MELRDILNIVSSGVLMGAIFYGGVFIGTTREAIKDMRSQINSMWKHLHPVKN